MNYNYPTTIFGNIFTQNVQISGRKIYIFSIFAHEFFKVKLKNCKQYQKYIIFGQGAHWSGKSLGNMLFLQGQGKVREFCKMVREIRKSSKVREF